MSEIDYEVIREAAEAILAEQAVKTQPGLSDRREFSAYRCRRAFPEIARAMEGLGHGDDCDKWVWPQYGNAGPVIHDGKPCTCGLDALKAALRVED